MHPLPAPPALPARRRLLLAAAAATVLPAGCATPARFEAPPAGAVSLAAPRTGQRWRYAEIDLYNGRQRAEVLARVVEAQPGAIRISLSGASGRERDDEIRADAARIVQEPWYDLTQVFEQPLPTLPLPLAAGQRLRTSTYFHTPAAPDDRLWWGDWLEAPGWQRVRVPAGEFLALRVDRTIHFRHPDIWREHCRRWDTAWYAPEVGRWVLRQWTGEWLMPDGPTRAVVYEDRIQWALLDWQA